MEHRKVTVWPKCQVTDDRSKAEFIGTQNKAECNGDKPTESGFSRETGFKEA